ncbi:hypothetical protein LX36DRAFT_115997 [Colletotrichum falcatum]|nr:hypothetical protein LX36DRAFT_115997 [Colletotrichum falcatum]
MVLGRWGGSRWPPPSTVTGTSAMFYRTTCLFLCMHECVCSLSIPKYAGMYFMTGCVPDGPGRSQGRTKTHWAMRTSLFVYLLAYLSVCLLACVLLDCTSYVRYVCVAHAHFLQARPWYSLDVYGICTPYYLLRMYCTMSVHLVPREGALSLSLSLFSFSAEH